MSDILLQPLRVAKGLERCSSFLELHQEGFTPLSLAPVYVYAGVKHSLLEQFAAEAKVRYNLPEVTGTTFHFKRTVVARCKGWNNILDVIDTGAFVKFWHWMMAQQYVDRERKLFFVVRRQQAPLLDPIQLDTKGVAVPTKLDVFSVSSNKGQLNVIEASKTAVKAYVDFRSNPPEEEIVVLAHAALGIIKES